MNSQQPILPGRLSDSSNVLKTDPRADPRMVAALAPFELDDAPPPPPVSAHSSLEEKLAYTTELEAGFEGIFAELFKDLPRIEDVERHTQKLMGVDGNEVALYVHRPRGAVGLRPCVYHIHGGGMTVLDAINPYYMRWRDELAAFDMVVIGVEFRNAGGRLGNHPFPAGLSDCMSGLEWTHEHKDDLGISAVIASGESGGGNLCLALTLKAKQAGRPELVDGTYAMCPYVSGSYYSRPANLPSLYENDDLLLGATTLGVVADVYDPEHAAAADPLCWPLHAKKEDLEGLPPHVVSVNELDPLRDEGLAYYRKLLSAGVDARGRTVNGTCHAGDMLFRRALPEVYAATVRDIKGFADSVSLD